MLFRLLILGAVVALVYRAAKTWFGTAQQHHAHSPGGTPQTVDDEMIKDPECGVYFPRRTAVALNYQNREMLYFCSSQCRDRYIARQSDKASS